MAGLDNIHAAMLSVYKKVGYVQKTGNNSFQKYRYASEADFIEALRPAMVEAGILVYPIECRDVTYQVVQVQDGQKTKVSYVTAGTYKFRFTHAESGTSIDVEVRGEGNDSLDKASYKAATGALKYALRQSFMIETGNDPDDSVGAPPPAKPEPTAEEKKQFAQGAANNLVKAINEIQSIEELTSLLSAESDKIGRLRVGYKDLHEMVDSARINKINELNGVYDNAPA